MVRRIAKRKYAKRGACTKTSTILVKFSDARRRIIHMSGKMIREKSRYAFYRVRTFGFYWLRHNVKCASLSGERALRHDESQDSPESSSGETKAKQSGCNRLSSPDFPRIWAPGKWRPLKYHILLNIADSLNSQAAVQ